MVGCSGNTSPLQVTRWRAFCYIIPTSSAHKWISSLRILLTLDPWSSKAAMLLNRWDHRAHHWYKSKGEFWVWSLQDRNYGQPNTNASRTGTHCTESRLHSTSNSINVTFLLYRLLFRPFGPQKWHPCSFCRQLACSRHSFPYRQSKTTKASFARARFVAFGRCPRLDLLTIQSIKAISNMCEESSRTQPVMSQWFLRIFVHPPACRQERFWYLLFRTVFGGHSFYKIRKEQKRFSISFTTYIST